MFERMKMAAFRVWIRLKTEERGAQTLEWLALALLILALLMGGTAFPGEVGTALKNKFVDLINNLN